MTHEQFEADLAAFVEQRLDDAGMQRFVATLGADESLCRVYVQYVELHATLAFELQWQRPGVPGLPGVQGSGLGVRERKSAIRNPQFAIGLAALIALALTAWFLLPRNSSTPQSEIRNPQSNPVAMLSDVQNAVFADSDVPMTLGSNLPPGPIHLAAGRAQLMFASSAVVDLTGPCEFEMTGPNRGTLRRGKITASVPQRARGFTINAATFSVIDLGTEFELSVHDDRSGELFVMAGTVELQSHADPTKSVSLIAGQGLLIDGDGRVLAVLRDELAQRPIYREIFANTTAEDRPIADAGWRIDKAAGRVSDNATLSGVVHDRRVEPIGSHPPLGAVADAFMLTMDQQASVDYLFWTDEHRIDHDRWRPVRVRWDQRHDDPSNVVRAALRIDGRWYALESPELTPGEEGWQHATLSLRDATWRRLDFTPGSRLQLGEIVTRQVGDISAFGLFVENRRGYKLRFDTIQIDAAPTLRAAYRNQNPQANPSTGVKP